MVYGFWPTVLSVEPMVHCRGGIGSKELTHDPTRPDFCSQARNFAVIMLLVNNTGIAKRATPTRNSPQEVATVINNVSKSLPTFRFGLL